MNETNVYVYRFYCKITLHRGPSPDRSQDIYDIKSRYHEYESNDDL